jgi:flagellar hook protein FlgE
MLRSMFSAISGLRAHQTKMDVTGNNIANVNTVGFKGSQTVFEDTLSQVIRAGGSPGAERGGTNPAQVGLGVKVAGITTNWTQGATQNTGRSTDFMIEGDGFFVVQAGNQQLFTRSGSFGFDAAGNLTTNSGAILQGWAAGADGTVNANGPIGNLSIPYGQSAAPRATGTGAVTGNLHAGPLTTPAAVVETSITMYDDLGVDVPVTYRFTQTGADTWSVAAFTPDSTTTPKGTATLDFATLNGTLAAGTAMTLTGIPGLTGNVTVDLDGLTQYGTPSTATANEQNGYAAGSLESFSLGNDGTITGIFSNGERRTLGQLALASFTNPGGLEKAGSSMFRAANNSGLPLVGQPGTGGRGVLSAGALEMSNVDLAEEFTGLIVAQRGFQANSRVITSSDEILQDLVNMKR